MDRSWISKPKTSLEYRVGIEHFLRFAFRDVPNGGKVLCPCVKCANCIMKTCNEIREDLKCQEFLRGYTRWNKHGEDLPPVELSTSSTRTCSIPSDNCPIETNLLASDDMHGLLHAAFGVPEEFGSPDAEENPTVTGSSTELEQVENSTFANLSKDANLELDDWLNHIYEISSSGHLRRRRGPTKMADVGTLPEDVKIVVKLDRFGIPNSKSSSTLGSYMGTLVRKPVFAPLNILRWDDKCFNQYKKNMIVDIESKFEIDSRARPWMLTELGNKWRQCKGNLKRKYYKPAVPLEQAIQTHPETVDQFQWVSLVSHWYSDKAKEISEKNKENAKNIEYPQNIREKEFCKEAERIDRTGRHVNRAVFFYECHKNKQGAYTNAATEEKMNDVYMKLAERMISRPLYEEVMVEVFGKDHSGRVRGMGPTITPTNYYGARF
ncbi:hypothetical protein ACP4OV_018801 [Aristida adscensionis]